MFRTDLQNLPFIQGYFPLIHISINIFLKNIFLMWTIFEIFIEFATILLLLFWLFGHKAHGILGPRPGVEPMPPALEVKVPMTGPSGKSLS